MKYIKLFILFFIIIINFSCKEKLKENNFKKNVSETGETSILRHKNKDSLKLTTNNQISKYVRNKNESARDFILRINNSNIDLNHPIIETDNWIKNENIIIVFKNIELTNDLGNNVTGNIYYSNNKVEYKKVKIDTYEPEGNNANIETIFFYDVDGDFKKELIILCSWNQRIKEIAEGKLFQTFIYDNLKPNNTKIKLLYLERESDYFGIEFDGIQDGKLVTAKFKTAKSIKNELINLKGKK